MATLIIFGVVALIVVVLLIVFNVRAAGNQRRNSRQANREPEQAVPASNTQANEHSSGKPYGDRPSAADQAHALRDDEASRNKADRTIPDKGDKRQLNDSGYRNALRQFQSMTTEDPPAKRLHMTDAQYRDALRSMQKQESEPLEAEQKGRSGGQNRT